MDAANSEKAENLHQKAGFSGEYQFSIGVLMVFFGAADLCFVIPNMYAIMLNLHVDKRVSSFYLPQWVITIPALLLISLVGALILCFYSISGIKSGTGGQKEYAAMIAAALGFTYQVLGAWPLWSQLYPWRWQAIIAYYGNWLVLPLFAGSLIALLVGAASLYIHSTVYHQNHPKTAE